MHDDNLSYAPTFEEALQKLFSETGQSAVTSTTVTSGETKQPEVKKGLGNLSDQIKAANDAFENYLKLQGQKKFEEAGKQLEILQQTLQQLQNKTKNTNS